MERPDPKKSEIQTGLAKGDHALSRIEGFPQKYSKLLAMYSISTAEQFVGTLTADRRAIQKTLGINNPAELVELEELAISQIPSEKAKFLTTPLEEEYALGALPPEDTEL